MRYLHPIRRGGRCCFPCEPPRGRVGFLCLGLLTLYLLLCCGSLVFAQGGPSHASEVHEHLAKAAEYLKANQTNAAEDEFNRVLALDPKNAEAYANLGVIAFFQADYQKASQNLRRALVINPALVKTQALLGICERRLGDPAAKALLEKSFPKVSDKRLRIQVGMSLAGLYEEQGDTGGTASVMRTLVDLDPDNVDILFMAQRVYSELADDTMNKLAVLAPRSARMQQIIAERLVNAGDLHGAIDHYRRALQIDPRLSGVHFELGEAILQSGASDAANQAEAEKEFKTAIAVDGDTARTECEFGSIAWSQSDLNGAMAHYQRAFQLNPGEVQAQLGLARILMAQEKPQEAIRYLNMAVQSDPLSGEAHYRLAQAYRRVQMPEKAEKEFNLVKEIRSTKEQVEALYHEMNIHKPQNDQIADEK